MPCNHLFIEHLRMELIMKTRTFQFIRQHGVEATLGNFSSKTGAFGASIDQRESVSLVVIRDETGINNFAIINGERTPESAITVLAEGLGAKIETAELPNLSEIANVIGYLEADPGVASRDSQFSMEVSDLPSTLSNVLVPGTWIRATIRPMDPREKKYNQTWMHHRLGSASVTHQSLRTTTMACSFEIGGPDADTVASMLKTFAGAMPGFDMDVRCVVPSGTSKLVWGGPLAGVILAAAGLASPQLAAELSVDLPSALQGVSIGAGVLGLASGVAAHRGIIPSGQDSARKELTSGSPMPPKRSGRPRRPRAESTEHKSVRIGDNYEQRVIHKSEDTGDYPLHRRVFAADPTVAATMIAPLASGLNANAQSQTRHTPMELTSNIGPMIGMNNGAPVYLNADDIRLGTCIFGEAGTGKSVLVRSLFAWHVLERVAPSGRKGAPGRKNAMIAFENKGLDGADLYMQWSKTIGDTSHLIDVLDPTTPRIDLFPSDGSLEERATQFVSSMVYAWGSESIGTRATPNLVNSLTFGLAVNQEVVNEFNASANHVDQLEAAKSPIFYAYRLLVGKSDTEAKALYAAMSDVAARNRAKGEPNANLEHAVGKCASIFEKSATQRASLVESANNKLEELIFLEAFWDPKRPAMRWEDVLGVHTQDPLSVILNVGSSRNGKMLSDVGTAHLAAMIMHSLKRAITVNCVGWLAQEKYVSIFADELSLLSGSTSEVIEWVKDQGRSSGIRAVFATQRPVQLNPQLRSSVMSYPTFISYSQPDPVTAAEIAAQVTSSSSEWTGGAVQFMPRFSGVVRTNVNGTRMDAVQVGFTNFEADMAGFATIQGYTLPTVEQAPAPVDEPRPLAPTIQAPVDQLGEREGL